MGLCLLRHSPNKHLDSILEKLSLPWSQLLIDSFGLPSYGAATLLSGKFPDFFEHLPFNPKLLGCIRSASRQFLEHGQTEICYVRQFVPVVAEVFIATEHEQHVIIAFK